MNQHVIFGAGSIARLANFFVNENGNYKIDAFVVDDDFFEYSKSPDLNIQLLKFSDFCKKFSPSSTKVFISVGYKLMRSRALIFDRFVKKGYSSFNVKSKNAYISKNTKLGLNNIFFPNVVVEPDVNIGNNNIFWSNTTICHDSTIGHHNFFASNTTIGGNVKINNLNFFGFSSTVIQNLKIKDENLIASSSLVLKDIKSFNHMQGQPALPVDYVSKDHGVSIP
mgnify:CR=1 FL=1